MVVLIWCCLFTRLFSRKILILNTDTSVFFRYRYCLLGKSKDNSANDNGDGGAAAAGRQLSKLSFVQFSDAAAVHKGPVGIKNGMMLLDSHWLGLAFETIGLYQF